MRVAVVAPLPPVRSGIASYVARQLPALARRTEVVLVTDRPDTVDEQLAAAHEVRGLADLGALDVDAVVYHLGNSIEGLGVARAVEHGPPGVVVAHDLSVHHLVAHVGLGLGHPDEYRAALGTAFGERGRRLADLRIAGERGAGELALFDLVGPLLARHRACVVHSTWAAGLVRRRVPGLPLAVVQHFAPEPVPPLARSELALPEASFLVGVLGNAVPAKRVDLVLGAVRHLVDRGRDVHLVVGGRDGTGGELAVLADELDLSDRTTLTGWLTDRELRGLAGTLDAVVALRSPHLGESSGPVPIAAAAGTPLVVWPIGAFTDIPDDAKVLAPVGGDEALGLADTVDELLANPARRSAVGARARRWAHEELGLERCVDQLLAAVAAAPVDAPEPATVARPWGTAVGPRRPGRATVTAAGDDATALRDAGWQVRVVDGAADAARAPVGGADLVVWEVRADEHVDRAVLDAVHRSLHPTGCLVAHVPVESLARTLAAALASAGFGGAGLDAPTALAVDDGVVVVAEKVGAGR